MAIDLLDPRLAYFRVGASLRSRIHGGLLTIIEQEKLFLFKCINHDNSITSHYDAKQLLEDYDFYEMNKTFKLLYGK
jgi:hypothetical protein